jgi:hypothetical protein
MKVDKDLVEKIRAARRKLATDGPEVSSVGFSLSCPNLDSLDLVERGAGTRAIIPLLTSRGLKHGGGRLMIGDECWGNKGRSEI